jgi:hypothetical protein
MGRARWLFDRFKTVWGWWGWIADHVSRVLLIFFVIGGLLSVGAVMIALVQNADPLTVYLVLVFVPLALFALGVWSAVGVRAWQTSSGIQVEAPLTESARKPKEAKFRVTPMHNDTEAWLRVENLGDENSVAVDMVRMKRILSCPFACGGCRRPLKHSRVKKNEASSGWTKAKTGMRMF